MKPADFWKNFRLGEEVHISGTFIYNGLRRFHELQHFESDDELFEFLYELCVGLERLLKIAIVLFEHSDAAHQTQLEESLITHNHVVLTARLQSQKIAQNVYAAIKAQASALNMYTYELRHGSKAQSVFLRKVDLAHEDVLWKELLIFFMNVEPSTKYLKFLKEIKPLGFDPGLLHDYLECFKSDAAKAVVMDELEHHYMEMGNDVRRDRFQRMTFIGAQGVFYWNEENDADE